MIGLSKEGIIERIPLGDKTNLNNSYLKYSPCKNTLSPTLTTKPKSNSNDPEGFEPLVEEFEESEAPITADFRQLSGKNELKMFLQNVGRQI